jgi:hypothetical protein
MFAPVFQVDPLGRLANQMIQYMVALSFVDRVGDCRISNVSLPAWGIHCPRLDTPGPAALEHRLQHIDLPVLAEQVRSGRIRRVEWSGYGQRLENFLPRNRYEVVFVSPFDAAMGYGPEYLVCPVRAEDVLHGGTLDYVLTPVEFYRDIIDMTGLRPVFIGQTQPNAYMDRIHAAFPSAIFRAPQHDPLVDFETIRQSRHVVVGVSTYSWLAAWLSNTVETIHMTVSGLFHPRQYRAVDLLPFGDERFRFYLFPINYAVNLDRHAEVHRRIAPYWHPISHGALRRLFAAAPRFGLSLDEALAVFDEAYYLEANPDVAEAGLGAGQEFARAHYRSHGFHEGRVAMRLDPVWYATRYPLAAFEVGRVDYADLVQHYLIAGRARGYHPYPAGDEW